MKCDIQKSLEIYQEQLSNGFIQTAYTALTKYVAELKGKFALVLNHEKLRFELWLCGRTAEIQKLQ